MIFLGHELSPFMIAQIAGTIGMIICIARYQLKNTKHIILTDTSSVVFFITQNFLLGGFTGAVLNIVAVIRNLLICYTTIKTRRYVLFITSFIALLITIKFANNFIDYLPFFGFLGFGLANLFHHNPILMRSISLVGEVSWLVYAIAIIAIPLVLTCLFGIISGLIAIYRFERKNLKSFYFKGLKISNWLFLNFRTYP